MDNKLNSPDYYQAQNGQDIYDMLIAYYGTELWQYHAEMEAIQYIFRAHRKENYASDINKAIIILQRLLFEIEKAQ